MVVKPQGKFSEGNGNRQEGKECGMITKDNYHSEIINVQVSTLPEALRNGHEFFIKSEGSYDKSAKLKQTIDIYLAKLNEYLEKSKVVTPKAPVVVASKQPKERKAKLKESKSASPSSAKEVPVISEEVRFIKRFIGLHLKEKTPAQLLSFIKSLQRSIVQKKISKTSKYADEIRQIQDKLIKVYNENYRRKVIPITIEHKLRQHYEGITGSEIVYPSISFIRRFIGLQGSVVDSEKVNRLLNQIEVAIERKKLSSDDPYFSKVRALANRLSSVLEKKEKTLNVSKAELNGLMGILKDCGCRGLDGIDEIEDDDTSRPSGVMNSLDFLKLKFEKLGFQGKWKEFIGDPSKGFTAMVFGRPKFGKSYLCIEFAGYLAQHHGKVLYVAKEEELDDTLQKKLRETSVGHSNLFVSDILPDDLSDYDFIFLDSVSKMKLTPEELEAMQKRNSGKSFVYIFQVRKDGIFRGRNDFQHDVDVVIEVPEKGKAVQYGRFNQGGEINIFDQECVKF